MKAAQASSGISANGEWKPAFPGQRPPLQRNHLLRQTHGAYAKALDLAPRASEIADVLREQVVEAERFGLAIESAAICGARVEAAIAALTVASPGELRRLDQDCRGWMRLWLFALGSLGLTPSSSARILRDAGLGKAAAAHAAMRGLAEHVASEYAEIEQ